MSHTTQRVENLKKDFMKYHHDGYSIRDIADIFHVDFSTVYNHLQEIAETHGVTRESLLVKPNTSHSSRLAFQKDKTDVRELQNGFTKVVKDIGVVVTAIDKILLTREKE